MSHRTVKRVPLDFDWPLKKKWVGYVCPVTYDCPDCERGQTHAGWALDRLVHLILIAGGSPKEVHPWLRDLGIHKISEEMTALTTGLSDRAPRGRLGHDACDGSRACHKIIEAAGLKPKEFFTCKTCDGCGYKPETKRIHDAWKDYDPPKGDGWQLWETTSEGSPVSPVFKTPEELAHWCEPNATFVAHVRGTEAEWLKLILADMVYEGSFGLIVDGHVSATKDLIK